MPVRLVAVCLPAIFLAAGFAAAWLLGDTTRPDTVASQLRGFCAIGLGAAWIGLMLNLSWDPRRRRYLDRFIDTHAQRLVWLHRHGERRANTDAWLHDARAKHPGSRSVAHACSVLGALHDGPLAPLRSPVSPTLLREFLANPWLAWMIAAVTAVSLTAAIAVLPSGRLVPSLHAGGVAGWCLRIAMFNVCMYFVARPLWTLVKLRTAPRFNVVVAGTFTPWLFQLCSWFAAYGQVTLASRPAPGDHLPRRIVDGTGVRAGIVHLQGVAATPLDLVIADLAASADMLVVFPGSDEELAAWLRAAPHPDRVALWTLGGRSGPDGVPSFALGRSSPLDVRQVMQRLDGGIPSGGREFTSNVFSNHIGIGALLAVLSAVMLMFGGTDLARVGVLAFAGTILVMFPYFLGGRRRASLDRSRFRIPRAPRVSRLLSYHLLHSIWLEVMWNVLSVLSVMLPLGKRIGWWSILAMAPITFCSRFVFTNGCIHLVKWLLDTRFRIVVFRRNAAPSATVNRRVVMPMCGAFGQLISIVDRELTNARPGVNADSEAILSEVNELLQDHLEVERDEANPRGWCRIVIDQLDLADFAVFHWQEPPTENMLWEYHQAKQRLPVDRMMFVCSSHTAEAVTSLVREDRGPDATGIASPSVIFGDPEEHEWTNTARFRAALYAALSRLRPCPRRLDNASPGVGPGTPVA